jgi:arylsulfatase A-like enzyme
VSDDTIDRRAALLTGRNHHAVGMGGIPEASSGFPGASGARQLKAALGEAQAGMGG